jgi:hypothetical protein
MPSVCAGAEASLPFEVLGTPPANLSYVVEAQFQGQSAWQVLPTTGAASPLRVRFPVSWAGQWVQYRVVGLDATGGRIPPLNAERVYVNTTPNVRLTSSRWVAASSDLNRIDLLDSAARQTTVLLSNGTHKQQENADWSYFVLARPGTYSIVTAYNPCGVGIGQGEVTYRTNPSLTVTASQTSYCGGDTLRLRYTMAQAAPGSVLQLRVVGPSNTEWLFSTSVLSGTWSIPLSTTLPTGNYSIRGLLQNPAFEFGLYNELAVNQLPSISFSRPTMVWNRNGLTLPLSGTLGTSPGSSYTLTLATPDGLTALTFRGSNEPYIGLAGVGSYSLVGVANACGIGRASGSLSVVPIPASQPPLNPFLGNDTPLPCGSRPITITTADLNAPAWQTGNVFTVYVGDSLGTTLRPIPSQQMSRYSLSATLPADLPVDQSIRLWVGGSRPRALEPVTISGGKSVVMRSTPSALLTGSVSVLRGDLVVLSVALTGTSPWRFGISGPLGSTALTATYSTYSLPIRPDSTVSYRLTHVQNDCGSGPVSGTALITVLKLLTPEPELAFKLRSWPNPTAGTLQLEGMVPGAGAVQVRVHTLLGTLVQSQTVQPVGGRVRTQLDMSALPTSTYLLTAEQEGRSSTFKVVKE